MRPALIGIALSSIALALAWADGYRLNLTPSLPRGFYKTVDAPPETGALVLFCLPEDLSEHPAILTLPLTPCTQNRPGPALMKRVLWIEGHDAFLVADHPMSVDSRSFGPIPMYLITQTIEPVWTASY